MLHQRHMLVGGGVEHDLRPVKLEELLHHIEIADIGDDLDDVLEVFLDLARDLVEIVFVLVEQNQLRRLEPAQLPNQLRSDRAAGAGHENPAAAVGPRQLLEILGMS